MAVRVLSVEWNTAKAGTWEAAPPPEVKVDGFTTKLIEF
jgi:hypothetical protein